MDLKVMTVKEVASMLNVSNGTAKNYVRDIKSEFGLTCKKITVQHLKNYFKL